MILSTKDTEALNKMLGELTTRGEPHAIATIVRTVNATSAKPGSKAVFSRDGTLLSGWIGSGCARGAVSRAAQEALRSGEPQYVSLRPEELLEAEGVNAGDAREGIRFARNGCPSKGSMDIFIEPVLPLPQLAIVGSGPVGTALNELARNFDYSVQNSASVQSNASDQGPPEGAYVVIATQGKGDLPAIKSAIARKPRYLGFVGSRKKFAALRERLLADGVDPGQLDGIQAPAGLHIHAITPDEIALSILAQITAYRRAGERESNAVGN